MPLVLLSMLPLASHMCTCLYCTSNSPLLVLLAPFQTCTVLQRRACTSRTLHLSRQLYLHPCTSTSLAPVLCVRQPMHRARSLHTYTHPFKMPEAVHTFPECQTISGQRPFGPTVRHASPCWRDMLLLGMIRLACCLAACILACVPPWQMMTPCIGAGMPITCNPCVKVLWSIHLSACFFGVLLPHALIKLFATRPYHLMTDLVTPYVVHFLSHPSPYYCLCNHLVNL